MNGNMREIKFRGKNFDTDEWVFGSLTQFFDDKTAYICGKQDLIAPNGGVCPDHDYEEEVSFDTVGQFTGFFDKNDNEIYEGDIVRYKVGKIVVTGPVSWSQDGALWIKGSSQALSAYKKSTEIIGNIHENPELLEEDK